ncbi:MAG: carbohydrate kinase family protein [Anaerolineae bacterium]|nr:carbohydrate kinase family protein [Anaerolineae bacterium]
MAKFLISGLINIETTLKVESFPIPYRPVDYPFFGIESGVSGVGYNIAKAFTRLGNQTRLLSLVGQDLAAKQVYEALLVDHIPSNFVLSRIAQTAQSVILFDQEGCSQIHVDLKNIQEQSYPVHHFEQAMAASDLLVLCNINFSRPFLPKSIKAGKVIATDVHAIADLEDDYNRDFMESASILFMSDELLPVEPVEWAKAVMERYAPEILVIGLGEQGALLAVRSDDFMQSFPSVQVRPVVNTIGAGDALFSAFLHIYTRTRNPYEAIEKAIVYAAYKVGASSASAGLLTSQKLERVFTESKASPSEGTT